MSRFREKTVYIVSENMFQSKTDPSGCTANPTGQIDKERMFAVHHDILLFELICQSLCCHTVTEEKISGVFIIDKMTGGIICSKGTTLCHRVTVIPIVFYNIHSMGTEQLFFPHPCGGGHMYCNSKTEMGTHKADAEAKVPG